MSKCPNCSAELTQEYCSNCGQRRIRPDDLSARRFFRELFDEVANLDMKFKTVRTLRGLAIPGWLTAEYLGGRRQRYLTPFKVYLVCAAIFFLSAPLAGFNLASRSNPIVPARSAGWLRRASRTTIRSGPVQRAIRRACAVSVYNRRRYQSGRACRHASTTFSEAALAVRGAPAVRAALRRVHVPAHHRCGRFPQAWTCLQMSRPRWGTRFSGRISSSR